ncbi:Na+-transporting NADH:ubiquinone oxidoreductase subunit B [Desulfuromusa kysingii]|uniref:Na+-transporting NADH:ubiquinone oxidoreductase subunit B n=1 Tax=Desulfuromusa kysingii TaxID=37625 RepID=A0A1H4DZS8_9BACT|nr:NADH:ubiquinone reductase (Na(+)-transporting) subunit B [Desulfuromusa kysingii]SEA78261.1 Na+-transporting NADH:ubiquinone oxidoreductase subunit B [Desulfuromusa kysingii]
MKLLDVLSEAVGKSLYSPADVTTGSTHVRDSINHKRVMSIIMLALLPCILMAIWNSGFQANLTLNQMLAAGQIDALPALSDSTSLSANMLKGLWNFLPMLIVVMLVQAVWVAIFAAMRKKSIGSGFLVTSVLIVLLMPPTAPLWQVALAASFGVVIGREIFGGTGMNFLNPALVAWVFMSLAYSSSIFGDAVWTDVDGYAGATPLAMALGDGVSSLAGQGVTWQSAFLGTIPGAMGETSTLACLFGAAVLLITGIGSWRTIVSILIGVVGLSSILCIFNPEAMSPAWHLVLGGMAFGIVFLATDHSASAMTTKGQWITGILIGLLIVVVRIYNPTMPESVGVILLFGSVMAPLIDRLVVNAHIKKRKLRHV